YFVQLRIAKVKQTTTNGIDSTYPKQLKMDFVIPRKIEALIGFRFTAMANGLSYTEIIAIKIIKFLLTFIQLIKFCENRNSKRQRQRDFANENDV
ncbi:MAG: hypothetical protein M0C28_31490, partial [Candidatus Moduliflexus flocculans]|nr:hypothetical protein [Candidatus Moduliflexus flocculans]